MEKQTNNKLINKLNQNVINKICAGEVIHRPLNVVKELIENSLDAGATNINVTVKNGGLKQIIIQDNGCGINKEDLKIVCDPHTTSKLNSLDDFASLKTFGFRGEALSSISIVAQVTIISKTEESLCGYKAEYIDGHLKDENSIIPIACSQGTTIIIDNLFYNMPTRKAVLSSETQEFSLIQENVLKYSLIFSGRCEFLLKKHGESNPTLNTKLDDSLFTNLDRLYRQNISPYLIPISIKNEKVDYKIEGYFSNKDLNLKKIQFILSINSRLVECQSLKKSLKTLYENLLSKGGHPLVLISIDIDPKNLDVNVHPTKNEVCFLYDNEIISSIIDYIVDQLKNENSTSICDQSYSSIHSNNGDSNLVSIVPEGDRDDQSKPKSDSSFIQSTLGNFSFSISKSPNFQNRDQQQQEQEQSKTKQIDRKINEQKKTPLRPDKFVRIDHTLQRLDQYLTHQKNSSKKRRIIELTSLMNLRQELGQNLDHCLLNIISESNCVGCVNENFLLIQHQLNLFMLRLSDFNQELFYQIFLADFGNFDYLKIENPLSIQKLLSIYFEFNSINQEETKLKNMVRLLISKRELLDDYFSIKINEKSENLEALPVLIENHQPNFTNLPEFIHSLITEVDWNKEKSCFENIGKIISKFYSKPHKPYSSSWSDLVQDHIYPLYKNFLLPSNQLQDGSFHLITNLTNLYKVFERC